MALIGQSKTPYLSFHFSRGNLQLRKSMVTSKQYSSSSSSDTSHKNYPEVFVTKDFISCRSNQLSVFKGDIMQVLDDDSDPNWSLVREVFSGKIGLVPAEFYETDLESQARKNTEINMNTTGSLDLEGSIPTHKSQSKSVSFLSKSPEILSYPAESAWSSDPTENLEEILELEEKFEDSLNLKTMLSLT